MQDKEDTSTTSKTISTSTSNDECPFHECDGSGQIIYFDDENVGHIKDCRCRELLLARKRLNFANMPDEFLSLSIKSFDTDIYKTDENRNIAILAKKAVANFIRNYQEFAKEGKGLYLYSKTKGSGKTRLAASVGNAAIKLLNKSVKFVKTIDLMNEIKATFDKEARYSKSQIIEAIKNVDILILDDVGVENQTSFVNEIFYSILDHRMSNLKVTLFTSNLKIDELKLDDRIKSRIEKMAIPISLPEESIRHKLSESENTKLESILFK